MNKPWQNFWIGITFLVSPLYLSAQVNLPYQTPPESIRELVDAANTPSVNFNRNGDIFLVLERPDLLSIEDVSQPVLGLAGLRINPLNNTSTVTSTFTDMSIKEVSSGKETKIDGLPTSARIGNITWSPDENWIAFSNSTAIGLELWLVDLKQHKAKKISQKYLNGAFGDSFQWTADSKQLLAQFIPEQRGLVPEANLVPKGPVIQESLGKTAPARTYQNLLQNPYDIELFDYYLTAQLELIDIIEASKAIDTNGASKKIGGPAIYRNVSYSPDGQYLLVQQVQKPYSYLVTVQSFPYTNVIWDSNGKVVKDLGLTPSAENQPIGSDVVATGPRSYTWRPDAPSTLYWAEAQDGGNPNKEATVRDAVYTLSSPFTGLAVKFVTTSLRYGGINWADGTFAILNERWRKSRKEKATLIHSDSGKAIRVIADRSSEDTYTDPGRFVYTTNKYNRSVLLFDKGKNPIAFTTSTGSSPEGDRPFLLKWNLISGKMDTLFKSRAPYYEAPVLFKNNGTLLISRESTEEAPNYYSVNLKNRSLKAVTDFKDPYPTLKGVQKQQLSYPRKDGLTLTGTLYLPKEYKKEDGPLPMLLWAYPREFKSAEAASQVKGSPYRFTRLSWGSPIYWVTRGYAILDNADMPIVGEGDKEPNDTFIAQIQDNAEAAINYVAGLGVADPKRVAVGGHSYGAFMTANLLSHTNLFAAGLARSGAYNRTFTPFGFQAEERTYWEAPDVYYNMSPFSFADKIKTPILFIHGIDDENSGTFPIQSERLYNAIKGHGGTTRLVMLPKEFHGYRAKESIFHTLWEMDQWLEKYVKNKK